MPDQYGNEFADSYGQALCVQSSEKVGVNMYRQHGPLQEGI